MAERGRKGERICEYLYRYTFTRSRERKRWVDNVREGVLYNNSLKPILLPFSPPPLTFLPLLRFSTYLRFHFIHTPPAHNEGHTGPKRPRRTSRSRRHRSAEEVPVPAPIPTPVHRGSGSILRMHDRQPRREGTHLTPRDTRGAAGDARTARWTRARPREGP